MYTTAQLLKAAAGLISVTALHTGEQMADRASGALDVCTAAYWAAHRTEQLPAVFFTDECASLDLIEASEPTMAAIRAISAALDSEPCETNGVPDYIEHVSNWAATAPIGEHFPPRTSEVIGCILRAADTLTHQTAA
ncbi:hypothetical protein ACN6K5_003515 [Streptomyces violaceoruber]|uniref:hypothetical protein n=1 Tax=Streptomyces violaceoruber TaxID=1935 RepID=UPI00403C92A9